MARINATIAFLGFLDFIDFLIMMNTLYVVATPIGHLSDLSQRAISTLVKADTICVEDKRVSKVLLEHIGARAELIAVHQHNEMSAIAPVLERLRAGKVVALISDAGTPGISDPGAKLISAVRAAGFLISPIPGPSALGALMSVCGFADHPPETSTLFEGFLPSKTGDRNKRLKELANLQAHLVFYEAPHRIVEAAQSLAQCLGQDRQFVVGRELTKRFEQIHAGKLSEFAPWLNADADHLRGEFVIAVAAPIRQNAAQDTETAEAMGIEQTDLLRTLLAHIPLSQTVKVAEALAKLAIPPEDAAKWKRLWGKSAIYAACLELQKLTPDETH
jgi:16S rRNA (cytidine1402-2'-O)-methyltransferase